MNCGKDSKKPKPEFPPLLPAGKHVLSEADLRKLTVDNFQTSTRRGDLWQGLLLFRTELLRNGIAPARIWVDGSFLTEKVDPCDIDLIVEVDNDVYENLSFPSKQFVNNLTNQPFHVEPGCLHTFVIINFPVIHIDHSFFLSAKKDWEQAFGHALLSKKPKGIAILEVMP